MPVITRNQKKIANKSIEYGSTTKNLTNIKPSSQKYITPIEREFHSIITKLLKQCEEVQFKSEKMEVAREIFKEFNEKFHTLFTNLHESRILIWVNFAAAVFDKTTEFNTAYMNGELDLIDKKKVTNFIDEYTKARNYTLTLIKNYDSKLTTPNITKAKAEIERIKNSRPRRNIKRVDYTGMDTIEPESEYDGITDIWFDETIECDPDYVFEEDEDDEEDNPRVKLTQTEKIELKEHLVQLIENHRIKRNVARVNYTGMDMTEEDEGQINICKRTFENGKVKYIWKKYSLSKANEIDDEDYQEE